MAAFANDSQDPHSWKTFTRTAADAGADPEADAQFAGGYQNATALIHHKFTGITSVTFQVMFWNKELAAWMPGPEFTKTPTSIPEKVDLVGSPFGILVKSKAGAGSVVFAVSISNRRLGGN